MDLPQRAKRSLVVLLAVAIGCAPVRAAPPAASSAAEREAPFLRANDQAMQRMMKDMMVRPSGDIDRDFARMMIPHHQGGIDMARALLRHGKSVKMRALARAIIAQQEREIVVMRRLIAIRR